MKLNERAALAASAERRVSEAMLKKQAKGSKRITVGEDRAYDISDHIAALRRINVTPHVPQNDSLTRKPGNRFRQTEIQQQRTETAWPPQVFQQTARTFPEREK